uniref:RING-type domain-containing protein n=1 Tax=Oryza brachyantha TaxID=4533 RepID=J3L259_ORYBR
MAVETRISIGEVSYKMSAEQKAGADWTTSPCSSVQIRCKVTVKYASRRLSGNGKAVRDRKPDKPWTSEETRPVHTVAPGSDEACGVCKERFSNGGASPVNLPCEHAFHTHCALASLSKGNACPVCRHDMCGLVTPPWTRLAT